MAQAKTNMGPAEGCRIVDFDDALFAACPPQTRAELLMEAQLLAGVFATGETASALVQMAQQLSSGARDQEMNRAHARRLAAALKHLAKGA